MRMSKDGSNISRVRLFVKNTSVSIPAIEYIVSKKHFDAPLNQYLTLIHLSTCSLF